LAELIDVDQILRHYGGTAADLSPQEAINGMNPPPSPLSLPLPLPLQESGLGTSTAAIATTDVAVGTQAQVQVTGLGREINNAWGDTYTIVQVKLANDAFVAANVE
jgi:hypothetical protein